MKKFSILFVLMLFAAVSVTAATLQYQQQCLSQKMIRLHVVANSDSEEDQALKLKVRDAVLDVTSKLSDKEELPAALPDIEKAARECLAMHGSGDTVQVSLGRERFPTRTYDNFALPSGIYTALRVTIGEGQGHNWWCVAFPSICFRATAQDLEWAAEAGGFTQDEISLITQDSGSYVLKFKALELLQQLKDKLFK